jgi:hypothetical protein
MSLKAWEEAGVAKQFPNPSSCLAEILSLKSLDQFLALKKRKFSHPASMRKLFMFYLT